MAVRRNTGLFVVRRPKSAMSPHRITVGNLYADILVDRRDPTQEIWHYILQREGSPEILFWGTCRTMEEATQYAKDLLNQFRAHAVTSAAS
jgi:hypothetical protein